MKDAIVAPPVETGREGQAGYSEVGLRPQT